MDVVETERLGRVFGPLVAVEGLELRIQEEEVFGLLGPNGAGKTTTARLLASLLAPTEGEARVAGYDVRDPREAMALRQVVGFLPETPGLYDTLSAYWNLEFYGRLYGVAPHRRGPRIEELLRWLGLWDRRDDPVAAFSKGMRQKVAIARALVHDPPVLILDEPTASLDPSAARQVREYVRELKAEGRTVLVNTHNLYEAERLCDRIGILRRRLLGVGSREELTARYWRPASVFRLRAVTDDVLRAVEALDFVDRLQAEDGELRIDLDDPAARNPAIARAIVAAGGEIEFIVAREHGLEDVYLRLLEEVA